MGVVLLSVKLVSMAGSRETEKDVMPAVEVMAPRVGGSSNVPLEGYRFRRRHRVRHGRQGLGTAKTNWGACRPGNAYSWRRPIALSHDAFLPKHLNKLNDSNLVLTERCQQGVLCYRTRVMVAGYSSVLHRVSMSNV